MPKKNGHEVCEEVKGDPSLSEIYIIMLTAKLKPFVETALENFGADRCMFGSDWPVCELAASYQQVFEALKNCIGELSDSEKAKILGLNAIEFYGLNV